eukprot:289146-Hanusia_phi.AAC.1
MSKESRAIVPRGARFRRHRWTICAINMKGFSSDQDIKVPRDTYSADRWRVRGHRVEIGRSSGSSDLLFPG